MAHRELNTLSLRLFSTHLIYVVTATPPLVYMVTLTSGFSKGETLEALYLLPVIVLLFGLGFPFLAISTAVKRALDVKSELPAGERLSRILRLPRIIELRILLLTTVGVAGFIGPPTVLFAKNMWRVPWSTAAVVLIFMLVQIQERLAFERILRPHAIGEFHRAPEASVRGRGFLWPRQRWYLPYAFGLFVLCAAMTTATILGSEAFDSYLSLRQEMVQGPSADHLKLLDTVVAKSARESIVPILLIGAYLLINAGLAAWRLAENQSKGSAAVQRAMEGLASGKPSLPEWASTDETGDLALATARMFEQFKAFSHSLVESAASLKSCAENLNLSTTKHAEAISIQAAALQETQVTAQEIKQTSMLASEKAEAVLKQTERADEISNAGQAVLNKSLDGLQEIGDQVREMAKRINALDERTRQIANITGTVKDLADQSNMLALNAAIEAVRSGEHGKGFGVVAREIRTLADQSIQATNSVREILEDITAAISSTVALTAKGSEKVEASLTQVREFGENIRQLSGIVRDNATSVRQITAAVTQQNAGIGQIFQAVNDLSKVMDQTMAQMSSSDSALSVVRAVAEKVSTIVGAYQWDRSVGQQAGS
jgi:methyl-accepting chemotaxis protein